MSTQNYKKIALGAFAGWFVFLAFEIAWTLIWVVLFSIDMETYMEANPPLRGGMLGFYGTWFPTVFVLCGIAAWLYAVVRGSLGPGPRTALLVGGALGFAAGVPLNLLGYVFQSSDTPKLIFLCVDLWGGLTLATLVAGWLYKE